MEAIFSNVQHVIVGAIEFICLLLDAIFERFGQVTISRWPSATGGSCR